jgi:hypothetical protein
MNEINHNLLSSGTTTTLGYPGTINSGTGTFTPPGINPTGNSIIIYSNNSGWLTAVTNSKSMTPKQVNVAVFTITRDADTNEINSTKFVKELWIEQKNGTSIDLLVAKQLDKDFDPEFTIIKVLATVQF